MGTLNLQGTTSSYIIHIYRLLYKRENNITQFNYTLLSFMQIPTSQIC